MQKVKEYPDPKNIISYAYAITREERKKWKKSELISLENFSLGTSLPVIKSE